MKQMKAFLLCAGEGLRFRPHTKILPKVLLPFLNIPLAGYNLFLLKYLNVQSVVANTYGNKSNLLKKSLENLTKKLEMNLNISYEKQLLGNAGGLKKAQSFLTPNPPLSFLNGSPYFYYLNGDSMIFPPSKKKLDHFYSAHRNHKALVTFLCQPAPFVCKKKIPAWDRIHSFSQTKGFLKTSSGLFDFCGLALVSHQIFKYLNQTTLPNKKYLLFEFLENLCPKELIGVYSVKDLHTLNMNQLSSYLEGTSKALNWLLNKKNPQSKYLKKILNFFSPHHQVLDKKSHQIFLGQKIKGIKNVKIQDFAVLGDYCVLKKPVQITRSVLNQHYLLNKNSKEELLL